MSAGPPQIEAKRPQTALPGRKVEEVKKPIDNLNRSTGL
jgi:hypothetical protein